MTDKQFHRIEDFWQEASFLSWTLGKDPVAAAWWENWLLEHPQQAPLLEEARQLLLAVQIKEHPLPDAEIAGHVSEIIQQLPTTGGEVSWLNWRAAAIAIGVLLLSGGAWLLTRHQSSPAPLAGIPDHALTEMVNNTGKPVTFPMKDGSTIILEPGAHIRYSREWGKDDRTVYLEGKAAFDVQQHQERPFIVNTGDIQTVVLGTTFTVTAGLQHQNVLVAVQHGKVAIRKNKEAAKEEMILLPNQEADYEASSGKLSKTLIPAPLAQVVVKHQEDFIFNDTPVSTVFEKLEKVYSIRLMYDTATLKSCTITANLNKEAFYDKLDLICKALGLSYQEVDGQLMINGKGCKNN
ncbi:FecR family protein [Chitinophaga sp. 22321]|uniref:FecR domain-containing protein n=1 Tax=Chitinophaga hostae TaxID=2831022 RepID=A0ABS5IXV6_9BACT|nr:FecR family protein [Chitinophaga hostae]MBS0027794.1 FecR domain-containing protein [Chitinophaga hostae]